MAHLDDTLKDKTRPIAERVAALNRLPSAEGHKSVWDVVHDETDEVQVRIAAVKAIGRSRGAINQLARRFHPPEVRAAAVGELERIAQQPPDPRMEQFFSLEEQMIGANLAGPGLFNLAVTYGRDRRLVEAARRASTDPRPDVRAAAIGALAPIGEIDDVLGAVDDEDARVRAQAAYLIGFFSLRRDKDVAALEHLTRDADANVRAKAKAGLRRLGVESVSRMRRRTPRTGDPVWLDLLEKLSAKVLADRELAADLPDDAIHTGWLGTTGATTQQLSDAESRLGRRLPRSYRAFLETSKGWYTTSFFCERLLLLTRSSCLLSLTHNGSRHTVRALWRRACASRSRPAASPTMESVCSSHRPPRSGRLGGLPTGSQESIDTRPSTTSCGRSWHAELRPHLRTG